MELEFLAEIYKTSALVHLMVCKQFVWRGKPWENDHQLDVRKVQEGLWKKIRLHLEIDKIMVDKLHLPMRQTGIWRGR